MQDDLDKAAALLSRSPAPLALSTIERALAAIWTRDEAHQLEIMNWVEKIRSTWRQKLHEIRSAERLRLEAERLHVMRLAAEQHELQRRLEAERRALENPCGSQHHANPSRCTLERGHDGPHRNLLNRPWPNAQCRDCSRRTWGPGDLRYCAECREVA